MEEVEVFKARLSQRKESRVGECRNSSYVLHASAGKMSS